jgi:hypothetical protein
MRRKEKVEENTKVMEMSGTNILANLHIGGLER